MFWIILGPLHCHTVFKISSSISTKKFIRDFDCNWVESIDKFWKTDILAIFSLPTHEYIMYVSLHLQCFNQCFVVFNVCVFSILSKTSQYFIVLDATVNSTLLNFLRIFYSSMWSILVNNYIQLKPMIFCCS